jgi:hypothetical protein
MIINEISQERKAQLDKWGASDDDKWTAGEWAALISHYATRHCVGNLDKIDLKDLRADFVKVGALVLAAIEAIDRK